MKYKELYSLKSVLDRCFVYSGIKFIRGVYTLQEEVSKEIEVAESCLKKASNGNLVEAKGILAMKHAKKDSDGKPMIGDGYVSVENSEAWLADVTKLYNENKKEFDEYNDIMESDVDVKFTPIQDASIPEDMSGTIYKYLKEQNLIV